LAFGKKGAFLHFVSSGASFAKAAKFLQGAFFLN
jgi:hypothetical protein